MRRIMLAGLRAAAGVAGAVERFAATFGLMRKHRVPEFVVGRMERAVEEHPL